MSAAGDHRPPPISAIVDEVWTAVQGPLEIDDWRVKPWLSFLIGVLHGQDHLIAELRDENARLRGRLIEERSAKR